MLTIKDLKANIDNKEILIEKLSIIENFNITNNFTTLIGQWIA